MIDPEEPAVSGHALPTDARHREELTGFFLAEFGGLLRVAMYAGATLDQAEEAAAQTMLELCQRRAEVDNPLAWARRAVVTNFVKVKKRDLERTPRTVAGGNLTVEVDEDLALTVWEDQQWVAQLLSRLPVAQREVMELIVEGLRPGEIALLLGKTPESVRKRLEKARARLRLELAGEESERPCADEPPDDPSVREGAA